MITIFAFDVESLSNRFLIRWHALPADDYNKTEASIGAIEKTYREHTHLQRLIAATHLTSTSPTRLGAVISARRTTHATTTTRCTVVGVLRSALTTPNTLQEFRTTAALFSNPTRARYRLGNYFRIRTTTRAQTRPVQVRLCRLAR